MSVHKINAEGFDAFKKENKVVLLDFYADWCGPCRMVAPVIEEIANERGDIAVGKINVDDAPSLSREFGVVSIPTIVVLKDGVEARRAVGARSKAQLLSLVD